MTVHRPHNEKALAAKLPTAQPPAPEDNKGQNTGVSAFAFPILPYNQTLITRFRNFKVMAGLFDDSQSEQLNALLSLTAAEFDAAFNQAQIRWASVDDDEVPEVFDAVLLHHHAAMLRRAENLSLKNGGCTND